MRKLFKNLTAIGLSVTMVVGTASMASAAVAKGTDVSNGKAWTSYSIHTREDNGVWEDKLIGAGQKYQNKENPYKSYGEDAKITTQTSSSFTMNVVSTGWSAKWTPKGDVGQSNPWGVTADKVVNVERGRYYTISFKIKSTLKNEIMKSQDKKDAKGNVIKDSEGKAMGENVGTGKYNYVKHIHFKAFDNTDKDGAALNLSNVKATIGGKSVLSSTKDFSPFVALDSQNTADDGYVTVSADVKIPSLRSEYQKKKAQPTLGIKFAFGAFLKEYIDESDMSGTIDVKDFKITAGIQSPSQVKVSKVTAKKKAMVVKYKKASKAKKYEVQYSLKKNFKKSKVKTTKKAKITIKKLKSGKKYYVRVRGFFMNGKTKVYGPYSAKKVVKIK